jgi:hypothetical protein
MQKRHGDIGAMGRFVFSKTALEPLARLKTIIEDCTPVSAADACLFRQCRNTIMLWIMLQNAKRTSDLTNLTIAEWQQVKGSDEDVDDHLVYVFKHKTSSSQPCAINFYGEIYHHTRRYVTAFRADFLEPSGLIFPSLNRVLEIGQLTHSDFQKCINRPWKRYREEAQDKTLPITVSSRFIRHSVVTAVHKTGDVQAMSDTARAMAHALGTAEKFYDETRGASAVHRASKAIRSMTMPNEQSKSS